MTAVVAVSLSVSLSALRQVDFGKTWSKNQSLRLSQQMRGFSGEIDEALAIDIALDEAWNRGLGSRFVQISTTKRATDFMVTFVPYQRLGERRSGCGVFISLDGKVCEVYEGG